ncbi:hypothetical protein [Paenibacillus kobensis]|uniref:hypothetical protein n=1 Tax=Paenibacillus kobensis TaxID=59841 RepID=UPI000FDC6DFF|nr:hypothetical protein [Paenibacillus kobensis]
MVVTIAVIIVLCIFLGLAGLSIDAKRKAGKVDLRLDYSHYNNRLILFLLFVSMMIWLIGIVQDRQLSVLILLITPLQIFVYNPVYLGEKGIKVGHAFIARGSLLGYRRTEDAKRITVELFVEGRPKPIKAGIYQPKREEEMMQALEQYFNRSNGEFAGNERGR